MMIVNIENAMIERLKRGLGNMVKGVYSYGGEMDGDIGDVIRALPACWITFGGIPKIERFDLSRRKYLAHGRFVVMLGTRSVRNEKTSRHGASVNEVGSYRLIHAVTRLLSGQDLGLEISHFEPVRVRTLFNTSLEKEALSVFACEFNTSWFEHTLENERFPALDDPIDAVIFDDAYNSEKSEPDPDLHRIGLNYDIPQTETNPDAQDIIDIERT